MVGRALLLIAIAGLASSTVYLFLALIAALRFRFAPPEASPSGERDAPLPAVSLLKPLHGMEPQLEENLESFFRQDYSAFELIFGARKGSDAALGVVEALRRKYPGVKTRVILSGEPVYPSPKVYALEKMAAASSYQYLVITDSDVRVTSDFLKRIVPPLLQPSVGLVTCMYRGVPTGGLWSVLEALGMSVEMTSGVLVAELLEGMKFALGPAMATRKDVLARIGGIQALGAYYSDDFVLGQLTHAVGKKVVLSRHVIDHVALNRSARASLLHQVRWMKSTRFSRPLGHLGSVMTFAMPFGVLGMAAGFAKGRWALGLGLLSVAVVNRVAQSVVVGWGVVRDSRSLRFCWLYPARDLLGFFLWCASFMGREIAWGGERYRFGAGGKMTREPGATGSAPELQDAEARRSPSRSVAVDHLP